MPTTRRGLFVAMKERVTAISSRVVKPEGARPSDQALKAAMRDIWRLSCQEKEPDLRHQSDE